MEQLSPSLRTRIYVIAGLEVAGIVLDIVMNASLLDLQPAPPRVPLLAACLALNLVLLLLAARLLEQASEEKTVRTYGRFVQVTLVLQLVVCALLLAALLGRFPHQGFLASLSEGLLNLGTSPSRYFVEFFGFLCAALLPLFLLRDHGDPPVLPADDQ